MKKRDLIKHIEVLKAKTLANMKKEYFTNAENDLITSSRVFFAGTDKKTEADMLALAEALEAHLDGFNKIVVESGYKVDKWYGLRDVIDKLKRVYNSGLVEYLVEAGVEHNRCTNYLKLETRMEDVSTQFDRILANISTMPIKEIREYLTGLGLMPKVEVVEQKNEVLAPVDMNILARYIRTEAQNG